MIMQAKPVVVVVEDDVELNQLQRELLAVHGMDSLPAYSGTEALEICRRCRTDAVLLDLMLPEMDGFETCRNLRRLDDRRLPIVVITALDGEDCRRRGFEVGADAYFAKPFDPDEVIGTLRRLIGEAPSAAPRPN
jgi:DNA-binding response OmpR family regulator